MTALYDFDSGRRLTAAQAQKLRDAMEYYNLPRAAFEIVECADEGTGRRFGERKCRKGWATKIGGGGRNKGQARKPYQVWAVVKKDYRK